VKAPAASEGAVSPLLTVFTVASGAHSQLLPAIAASLIEMPQMKPQFADGDAKLIAPLLLVWPPVPLDAVVEPADWVPAKFAREAVTPTRA
jgi:hypothetical protein